MKLKNRIKMQTRRQAIKVNVEYTNDYYAMIIFLCKSKMGKLKVQGVKFLSSNYYAIIIPHM